ncbi:hypothetical protein GGS24DRAFT_460743 [Hypoxylon argillaceum]|nr:hypothetical protein GGS24DRAFT_460743 [Hypoxylon argillaceum]
MCSISSSWPLLFAHYYLPPCLAISDNKAVVKAAEPWHQMCTNYDATLSWGLAAPGIARDVEENRHWWYKFGGARLFLFTPATFPSTATL